MSLSLSKKSSLIVQSEIRAMTLECARIAGINLAQGVFGYRGAATGVVQPFAICMVMFCERGVCDIIIISNEVYKWRYLLRYLKR